MNPPPFPLFGKGWKRLKCLRSTGALPLVALPQGIQNTTSEAESAMVVKRAGVGHACDSRQLV